MDPSGPLKSIMKIVGAVVGCAGAFLVVSGLFFSPGLISSIFSLGFGAVLLWGAWLLLSGD